MYDIVVCGELTGDWLLDRKLMFSVLFLVTNGPQ